MEWCRIVLAPAVRELAHADSWVEAGVNMSLPPWKSQGEADDQQEPREERRTCTLMLYAFVLLLLYTCGGDGSLRATLPARSGRWALAPRIKTSTVVQCNSEHIGAPILPARELRA